MSIRGNSHKTFFLGRQPILDSRQEIIGYELLFRDTEINRSEYMSQNQASMSVIASAMAGFGFREVMGDKLGFINVTEEVLLSDMVEILPREQTILELLESASLNEVVQHRAGELKAKGFRIALDDHVYSPEHENLYLLVDIIKVDILSTPPEELRKLAIGLSRYPVRLLAECVETLEQFHECQALGFELFQGYFFARPVVLNRKGITPSCLSMVKLLSCLQKEAALEEIQNIFRQNPELTYNLLKLVNSVHLGLREKVRSLRHAIMMLGLDKLRHWVQLAVFAGSDSRGVNNPLMELAAVRGRLMEYLTLARRSLLPGKEQAETAFMTGVLSLIDILFEIPMENILCELSVSDEIAAALLQREGELGSLLSLAEAVEQSDFAKVQKLLKDAGIPLSMLLKAQLDAFNWRSSIMAVKSDG
jgi:c-di-GMP-related signal transduction protein